MPSDETEPLVEQAIAGDEAAFGKLFQQHRPRLRKMVELRMHPRVQGRCDPSDVLQEAFIDAAKQLPKFQEKSQLPFFLWLRLVTGQRLAKIHREHLGAAKRDAHREILIVGQDTPDASTFNLASFFVGSFTSPSKMVMRAELRTRIQQVLDTMESHDREVLALRHFEELTIKESALVLGISETAASSRYRRAIIRIKDAFSQMPDLAVSKDESVGADEGDGAAGDD